MSWDHASLSVRLAVALLWILSLLQAAAAVASGGSWLHRAIGVAVFVVTTLVALHPTAGRWALTLATGFAGVAAINLAAYIETAAGAPPWRILWATVLFGYAIVAIAGAGALALRRAAPGLLVGAATLTLAFAGAEALLEAVWDRAPANLAGVRWVGGPVPHPVLQESYAPHSTAKTIYPSDPRGYFDRNDARVARWSLASHHAGSAGRLLFPDSPPDGIRVEIDRATDPTPLNLQLAFDGVIVRKHTQHVVAFRVRADAPRLISYGVTQAHAPWQAVGLYRDAIEVGTRWRDIVHAFTPTASDDRARLIFDIGGGSSAVEIQSVEVKQVRSGENAVRDVPTDYSVTYRFNDQGCRGPDYPIPAPPGRRRILALGDSQTLGVGVHEKDTFAAQLQWILNADAGSRQGDVTYDVINCGVSGYATLQERQMFEILAPIYRPDLVVLAMVWNDDASWQSDVANGYVHVPGKYERVMLTFGLLQRARFEGRKPAASFTGSLEEVRRLQALCERNGARLAVVAFRNSPLRAEWQRLVESMSLGLEGSPTAWLDLGERMLAEHPWEGLIVHPAVDYHPNEVAHRSAAKQIAALLRAKGWVD